MRIHIETEKLVIDIVTDQPIVPLFLVGLLHDIDSYPPHQVEAMLERDPAIASVTVDHLAFKDFPQSSN